MVLKQLARTEYKSARTVCARRQRGKTSRNDDRNNLSKRNESIESHERRTTSRRELVSIGRTTHFDSLRFADCSVVECYERIRTRYSVLNGNRLQPESFDTQRNGRGAGKKQCAAISNGPTYPDC